MRVFEMDRFASWLWKLRRHILACDDRTFVGRLLGQGFDRQALQVGQFHDELRDFSTLRRMCAEIEIPHGPRYDYDGMISPERYWYLVLYIIVRIRKPQFVIETGCASGLTSALILYALHQNRKGQLTSIDLPPKKGQFDMGWSLPEGMQPGFLVPTILREEGRWSLIQENVTGYLPTLLDSGEVRQVDLFFHDSDHSYSHQMWEYLTVWPHLAEGGLLLSDDIGWSVAVRNFSRQVRRRLVIHRSNANFGGIRK